MTRGAEKGGLRSRRRGPTGRSIAAALAILTALAVATGCGGSAPGGGAYRIAGGGPSGVYSVYAEEFSHELDERIGLRISAAETRGSVDNLLRVGSGRALLGFAQADAAADAVSGTGSFAIPLRVQAIARVYDEYVHVVVPADSDIRRISDLAGRTVSLGDHNSGVAVIAERVLDAAGVPLEGVDNPALGLGASIEAMERGEIEGFFWVGGLPTPGIERLSEDMPVRLIPIGSGLIDEVNSGHAGVYRVSDFPAGSYGITAATGTMTVPNYLIVQQDASDDLVHGITRVLFESRPALARSVPAAALLDRRQAIFTEPMDLHPGAAAYYVETQR